jgi:hypothetical protein
MPWNTTPIHIVFYKDTPMDKIEKIVEVHCKDHHETMKNFCMSLIDKILIHANDDCKFVTAKGDGHDIRVDMVV